MKNKQQSVVFILIILICAASGCAGIDKNRKGKKPRLNSAQTQELLVAKEERIIDLQNLLIEKERQLSEKDSKIEELRKKLEMFGVFEK